MSGSQLLLKCNERSELDKSSHFVNAIQDETTPSVADSGTNGMEICEPSEAAKVVSPSYRLKQSAGPSGSKCSTPRAKKRKKSRSARNSDDSESEIQLGPSSGGGPSDQQGRKKRQRRRKGRKYKPYNKLSWQERREQEDRETRRANRVRAQRFANGQPVAPYNTTQFLMDDHNDLKDFHGPSPTFCPRKAGARCRDSSFSLDSEEDFYYSSPEDEQEFLTKEFSSAYEDQHADHLSAQPKTKLVQDILTMEKKLDLLEKELNEVRCKERGASETEEGGDERVMLFKAEITKLSEENNRLRAENECLRRRCFGDDERPSSSSSSIDSDSDSTASSSCTGSCSSSSCSAEHQPCPDPEASLNPDLEASVNPDPEASQNPDPETLNPESLNPDPEASQNPDPETLNPESLNPDPETNLNPGDLEPPEVLAAAGDPNEDASEALSRVE